MMNLPLNVDFTGKVVVVTGAGGVLCGDMARAYAQARNFFYLGRGHCYPLALEGALKLKELSYIHAEGYASGEMKHGPIALIDPNFPTFALALVIVMQVLRGFAGKEKLQPDA